MFLLVKYFPLIKSTYIVVFKVLHHQIPMTTTLSMTSQLQQRHYTGKTVTVKLQTTAFQVSQFDVAFQHGFQVLLKAHGYSRGDAPLLLLHVSCLEI